MPRAADSDGDLAALLASRYGLTPDPWQDDVLDGWLGRRRDGRWSSQTCGLHVPRQNGKNALLEVRELFGMVGLGERFLHTAHEVKTARKAFLRIVSFFENDRQFPELAALVKDIRRTNGQEAVVLTNGGSVEFIARSRSSGRGFTVDALVLDEAQDLGDEALAALLPTISAAPLGNPQVLMTGTPPDPEKPDTGTVFRRIREDGEHNRNRRLCWTDFGVVDGPLPDVDDRTMWHRVNPALGTRLSLAEVVRERGLMSPAAFARERLGWWGEPAAARTGGAFGHGKWAACRVDVQREPEPTAIGVAVSLDRAYASIGAADAAPVPHLGAVLRHPGTAWVAGECARIQRERNVVVVVDGRGPGAALIPDLESAGVQVTVTTTSDYCDACGRLWDLVDRGAVTHGAYPELDRAAESAEKRPVGDRWAWGRKSGDVSMLEAVTLALWGAQQQTEEVAPWAVYV